MERTLDRARRQLLEPGEFLFGFGRAHALHDVQPRQRPHAIAPFGISERLVVGELRVAVRFHRFANHFGVTARRDTVLDRFSSGVDQAQGAIRELDRLILVDEAEVIRREVSENSDLCFERVRDLLVRSQGQVDICVGLRDHGQNLVALCGRKRLGHATGHNPARMHAFVGEQFDDALPEAPQRDAGAAQLGFGCRHAQNVPDLGIGLHAQQQIGRGEIKEAQRMRLHHLRQIQHAPQLRCGVRNPHRHDGLAGLG